MDQMEQMFHNIINDTAWFQFIEHDTFVHITTEVTELWL